MQLEKRCRSLRTIESKCDHDIHIAYHDPMQIPLRPQRQRRRQRAIRRGEYDKAQPIFEVTEGDRPDGEECAGENHAPL